MLLIVISVTVFAQKEASVWVTGTGSQLNFQSGNAELINVAGEHNALATICDEDGNLILYSDGNKVWNGNHEILINGEVLHAENFHRLDQPIFIPYPGKEGFYLMIYGSVYYLPGDLYKIKDKRILYAEIDINAHSKKGEVITKGNIIHNNYHSFPTIAGYCNNSYYWMVIDRNDLLSGAGRDRIYAYKIDENGVNPTPVINDKYNIGHAAYFKFSPNGDKIFCALNSIEYEDKKFIADFNFKTGEIHNFRVIRFLVNQRGEFSSDSRLFYFFSDSKIMQIDARYINSAYMSNTCTIIHTVTANPDGSFPLTDIQLGPDRRIYFTYFDVEADKMKIGRINKPNQKGLNCDIELDYLTANIYWFPEYITSFFRDKEIEPLDEVKALAGDDIAVCLNSSVTIGENKNQNAIYHWYPEGKFNDPFVAQPVFTSFPVPDVAERETYTLIVSDGNCWFNFDDITISNMPAPSPLPIDGSWSVCPYVEEVDYWAEGSGNEICWMVEGGDIASGQGTDTLKVNWKETSFDASVAGYSTNQYGCHSDTTSFPVRINVELITETPTGPENLCVADKNNIIYQIRNTNGSVYNWVADGGEIINGQGTNRVEINWRTEGRHFLTVDETSTTIDTVCYGESQPLWVEVINDSLEIILENVSFDLENKVELTYNSQELELQKHVLTILAEIDESGKKREVDAPGNILGNTFYYPELLNLNPETICLQVKNVCNELFNSNLLQTTVLKEHNIIGQQVTIYWNSNRAGEDNLINFEVWHAEGEMHIWERLAENYDDTQFTFVNKNTELVHYFRIKAIHSGEGRESWSNFIKVELEDDLNISDVFTPNGDGFNDIWEITNIQLHELQRATIFNRYGQKIYECLNEYVPWDGRTRNGIIQGTYLYEFVFIDGSIKRGQLTLLQ